MLRDLQEVSRLLEEISSYRRQTIVGISKRWASPLQWWWRELLLLIAILCGIHSRVNSSRSSHLKIISLRMRCTNLRLKSKWDLRFRQIHQPKCHNTPAKWAMMSSLESSQFQAVTAISRHTLISSSHRSSSTQTILSCLWAYQVVINSSLLPRWCHNSHNRQFSQLCLTMRTRLESRRSICSRYRMI